MPDWEQDSLYAYAPIGSIDSWSYESGSYGAWSAGGDSVGNLSPIANLAMYVPFTINEQITIYDMVWYNGSVVSGNIDVGIYSESGVKLFSSGSTVQVGTTIMQSVTLGSPLTITYGNYYMALCVDNATARIFGVGTAIKAQEILGVKQDPASFPLPSTATLAAPTQIPFPYMAAILAAGF